MPSALSPDSLPARHNRASGAVEAQVKAALVNFLRARSTAARANTIISELTLEGYRKRADMVLSGRITHCFEIKTRRDTLNRLDEQVEVYLSIFDLVSVVVATKHMNATISRVPKEVGIYEIVEIGALPEIRCYRRGTRHTKLVKDSIVKSIPVSFLLGLPLSMGRFKKRSELAEAARNISINTARRYLRAFLAARYGDASSTLFAQASDTPITQHDIKSLSLWKRGQDGSSVCAVNSPDAAAVTGEFAEYLGRCFGPVPSDIYSKVVDVNQPNLPRWVRGLRGNGPADEGDC